MNAADLAVAPTIPKAQLHALRGISVGLIRHGIGSSIDGEFSGRRVRRDTIDRLYRADLVRPARDGLGTIALTRLGCEVIAREGDGCQRYLITFDRIGDGAAPPLEVRASCRGDIEQLVTRYAKRRLRDWDVYVRVRSNGNRAPVAHIVQRGQGVGVGTIAELDADATR